MPETAKKTTAKKTAAKKTSHARKVEKSLSVEPGKANGFVVRDTTIGQVVSPWFGTEDEATAYLARLDG